MKLHTMSAAAAALLAAAGAQAVTFQTESLSGSLDSTVSAGFGMRTRQPSAGLVVQGASGAGAPEGQLTADSLYGDQGNLNYARGDFFTTYLKGSHELLLKLPEDVSAMARVSWLRDFSATHTTGYLSSTTPPGAPVGADGLSDDARRDLKFKGRVLDLWVSKRFQLGDQQARVRLGNQVISWGESLFTAGGINATNAVDAMRLSQPGTQLKEAILPAPMLSVATGLGGGFNLEAYVQSRWNANYFAPTGSYWSVINGLGQGSSAYGLQTTKPRDGGQWGMSLRWQSDATGLNLGLYALNYHDKSPQLTMRSGLPEFVFPEDRKLYGASVNFPVGDWAVGSELSFRPREAVPLINNLQASGCASQGGNCWIDNKRYQWNITGLLSLQPSGTGSWLLKGLGATGGTLMLEAVTIRYPGLQSSYGGDMIAAGGWGWGSFTSPGAPVGVGDKSSWGYNADFSWTYDGTLIEGWQVTPEVFFSHAVNGRTPTAAGTFMHDAKSANFIVSFVKNPASWQFGMNYAKFWGGRALLDQPLRDRDFIGAYVSRNF